MIYKTIVLSILTFSLKLSFAQNQVSKAEKEITNFDKEVTLTDTILVVTHYVNNEKNKQIQITPSGFYILKTYSDEGMLISETQVNPGIATDSMYSENLNGTALELTITQKFTYLENGPYTEWDNKRNRKTTGAYINGYKHGIWKYYNQANQIIKEELYDYGELINKPR